MYFVLCLLALTLGILFRYRRKSDNSKPPGPPLLPVIGNLLDIPREAEAHAYSLMADKYGDIVYMSVLGKNIYVVSSVHVLNDLFTKRSANYSDRPYSTMLNKLMDLEWIFPFQSYGNVWREQRKLFHSQFQESVAPDYTQIQVKSAHDVARKILASPDDLLEHLHMHVASFLMGMTYGARMTSKSTELVQMADEVIMAWSKVAVPGAYLVDVLPIIRHIPEWLIPGGGFHKDARECKEKAIMARDIPFEAVVSDLAKGTAEPSFVARVLAEEGSNADLDSIRSCAGTVYFAGTEAIAIVLKSFILAMISHPDVLARAQQEIDSVVGKDRLPTFEDRDSLPYINGLVHEALRWNPPAPLAIPHVTVNADTYKGYDIPAKSIVIGNLWKVLHNPEVFPDPMRFIPERFVPGTKGYNSTAIVESFMVVYGPGRRICPGRFVAVQQLFITIATIISLFDITPGVDDNGKPNKVVPEFTFGLACHPLPFKFKITPRGDYVRRNLDSTSLSD